MSARAYYNEHEPFAAAWLRNLIAKNLIAPGEVDERSIVDVRADDVRGFYQCHFFAGIGVWSLALRGAGWRDDRSAWTGSCPCQGFSVAGAGKGFDDERHLWPEFFRLIRECRPPVVLGEQVASPLALSWLDLVHDDLEGAGYAVGASDLCAAGVGAPHIRQRLYWVANSDVSSDERSKPQPSERAMEKGNDGLCRLANTGRTPGCTKQLDEQRQGLRREESANDGAGVGQCGVPCRLADSEARGFGIHGSAPWEYGHATQREPAGDEICLDCGKHWDWCACAAPRLGKGVCCGLADANGTGQQRTGQAQPEGRERHLVSIGTDPIGGFWAGADWLACTDGKARPVEPGTFPLAHGYTGRVGQLRAYGNALCEAVAQEFVQAVMECLPC